MQNLSQMSEKTYLGGGVSTVRVFSTQQLVRSCHQQTRDFMLETRKTYLGGGRCVLGVFSTQKRSSTRIDDQPMSGFMLETKKTDRGSRRIFACLQSKTVVSQLRSKHMNESP
jgi:hypothetical protein